MDGLKLSRAEALGEALQKCSGALSGALQAGTVEEKRRLILDAVKYITAAEIVKQGGAQSPPQKGREPMNLSRWIRDNKKTYKMTTREVKSRPDGLMSELAGARHYIVTISKGDREISFYLSKGAALEGDPTKHEALESLVLDCHAIDDSEGLEDFCDTFGYKDNVYQGLRVFRACQRQLERVRYLMGDDTFNEVMTCDLDIKGVNNEK